MIDRTGNPTQLDEPIAAEAGKGEHARSEPEVGGPGLGDTAAFLRRSLDDLDREFDAGDLEGLTYKRLRDEYTAAAAAMLRSSDMVSAAPACKQVRPASRTRNRKRQLVSLAAVLLVGGFGGLALARAIGTRVDGDSLTGSSVTQRGAMARCQQMSFSRQPARRNDAVACYDDILAAAPQNPEALTYRAWALYRMGRIGDARAGLEAALAADPSYPDVRVFRAVDLKDRGDFATAQQELDVLYLLEPSPGVVATLQQMGLDYDVAVGALNVETRTCWDKLQTAISALELVTDASSPEGVAALSQLADAVGCLNALTAQHPDDVTALTLEALGYSLAGPEGFERATKSVDAALAVRPNDPSALLIRGAIYNMANRPADSLRDLEAVGDRRVSPLLRGIDIAAIRQSARESLANAGSSSELSEGSSTTTSTAPRRVESP